MTPGTAVTPDPNGAPLNGAPAPAAAGNSAEVAARRLPAPEGVDRGRLVWPYVVSFTALHAMALLAFVPWLFSWSGAIAAGLGLYVFGTLGINLCYHRLLTHRGFVCPTWLERSFAVLGVCCLQDTPGRWVAIHRMHHQYSDEQPDPHSPLVALFWGHMGWLLVENSDTNRRSTYDRYARDVLRDPFYFWLERRLAWVWINVGQVLAFAALGAAIGWLTRGSLNEALRMAASLVVWGVILRIVLVWHITWSVNSLAHVWGYRTYKTGENSRNNWFVALVSNGEGWHNNHHADQRSAAHGHRWWELDVTYLTIRALEVIGLAKEVARPSERLANKIEQP